MRLFPSLLILGLLGATSLASPLLQRRQFSNETQCTTKLQRKSWHALSSEEKKAYIDAELCLMWQVPTKTNLPAAVSRFDDLIKAHQIQSRVIHNDGWFLPFHRLHMHAHEKLLREECGYEGAQPYWDEALDAGNFSKSIVFSATEGFGGDGGPRSPRQLTPGCIITGPFANYTLHSGPGFQDTDHCISRAIYDGASVWSSQEVIDKCLALDTFAEAWPCMEHNDGPHGGGHRGVGGEMMNPISSPGDPLFYLHHTFLDRVWWQWQEQDLPARLSDIAGFTTPNGPVNATLNDELDMLGVIPNATIADIMDIGGPLLCFEYV